MDIGKTLKDARIEKGFSLKDVEEATKIRSRYLKALENEDFNDLPGRVYGKAFLRTYARFLELDSDKLVFAFEDIYPQEKAGIKTVETKVLNSDKAAGFKKYIVYLTTFILIAGLMYTFNIYKNNMGFGKYQESNESQAIENGSNAAEHEQGESNQESQEKHSEDVQNTEEQILTLKVVSRECWIRVLSDGQKVYEQTVPAGETLEFKAEEGFSFTLGNAGAVEVIINGESYGFLGEQGDVVHYPEDVEGDGEQL